MFCRRGFTLIEIIFAIALIGLLATFVFRQISPGNPKEVREKFINKLNSLMGLAWQNAISTGKVHKVHIDLSKKERVITLEIAGAKDKYGKVEYGIVRRAYLKPVVIIPEQIEFRNIYVKGEDELARGGREKGDLWFFVVPDGMAQEVFINFLDKEDKVGRKKRSFSLVLNPFLVQFEVYDEFKKP